MRARRLLIFASSEGPSPPDGRSWSLKATFAKLGMAVAFLIIVALMLPNLSFFAEKRCGK